MAKNTCIDEELEERPKLWGLLTERRTFHEIHSLLMAWPISRDRLNPQASRASSMQCGASPHTAGDTVRRGAPAHSSCARGRILRWLLNTLSVDPFRWAACGRWMCSGNRGTHGSWGGCIAGAFRSGPLIPAYISINKMHARPEPRAPLQLGADIPLAEISCLATVFIIHLLLWP